MGKTPLPDQGYEKKPKKLHMLFEKVSTIQDKDPGFLTIKFQLVILGNVFLVTLKVD